MKQNDSKMEKTNNKLELLLQKWNEIYPEKGFWEEGKYLLSKDDEKQYEALHMEIVNAMPKNRHKFSCYSVCGWSERHGYFRNKHSQHKTIEEARECFIELKKNEEWRIPTVIVKETWSILKSNFRTLKAFLQNDFEEAGFSDNQELIEKNMMGNKSYRWKYLDLNNDRLTY
jgi:hypothetical protein